MGFLENPSATIVRQSFASTKAEVNYSSAMSDKISTYNVLLFLQRAQLRALKSFVSLFTVFSKLTILGANDDVAEKLVAVAVQILAFQNSVDSLTVISPEQTSSYICQ